MMDESQVGQAESLEVWFVTGSQHSVRRAHGVEAQVAENSRQVRRGRLNASPACRFRVVFKPVVTTPESIDPVVPRGERRGRTASG
jgi:L-arabinose isomerase